MLGKIYSAQRGAVDYLNYPDVLKCLNIKLKKFFQVQVGNKSFSISNRDHFFGGTLSEYNSASFKSSVSRGTVQAVQM